MIEQRLSARPNSCYDPSRMHHTLKPLFFCLLTFVIAGCASREDSTYNEPALSASEGATLRMESRPDAPVWVDKIDGKAVERPNKTDPYTVIVAPGPHRVQVGYRADKQRTADCTLTATAGRTYSVAVEGHQVRVMDTYSGRASLFP
jgi:hypothetical protein